MKFTTLVILFLASIVNSAQACKCGGISLLGNYQQSQFIATAKILKVVTVAGKARRSGYEVLDIEIKQLYKGKKIKKIKASSRSGSCSFRIEEGSSWLIFATTNDDGDLSFGFCSGSLQLDPEVDRIKYPTLEAHYKSEITGTLAALDFIAKNNLRSNAQENFYAYEYCSSTLTGFVNKDKFAVFEVTFFKDLTVKGVKIIKAFQNKELTSKLVGCLTSSLQTSRSAFNTYPNEIKLVYIYYFKETGGRDQKSYVTQQHAQFPAKYSISGHPMHITLHP